MQIVGGRHAVAFLVFSSSRQVLNRFSADLIPTENLVLNSMHDISPLNSAASSIFCEYRGVYLIGEPHVEHTYLTTGVFQH